MPKGSVSYASYASSLGIDSLMAGLEDYTRAGG
jgi:hypothetical protein